MIRSCPPKEQNQNNHGTRPVVLELSDGSIDVLKPFLRSHFSRSDNIDFVDFAAASPWNTYARTFACDVLLRTPLGYSTRI